MLTSAVKPSGNAVVLFLCLIHAMHAQVVLNNLYKYTALQMRFPVNAVALVNGTPQTLTLKEFLVNFLEFRCEVVKRRARHGFILIVRALPALLVVQLHRL